ncbi:MAG: FAD-dependent oxidoreductase, partial [Planctomycetota bacterium]
MKKSKENNKKIGSAMVVGGGIGGMQAALDLAESGIKVYFVEKFSAIGGRMTQLDKTFPTNECAMCVVSPKLVECGRHLDIDIITNSEIKRVEGEPGDFTVTLHHKSRYVDLEKCTGCEDCVAVCPVDVSNKFNSGLDKHKAIYRMYPQAVPLAFVIDKGNRAPCVNTCPAHINVQGYIALISHGKYKEAFDLIRHRVPFPGTLGRVCYHPCEGECNRKDIEQPLAINPLKRFVADFVYGNKESKLFKPGQMESEVTEEGLQHEEVTVPHDHPYSFDEDITEELVIARKDKKVAVIGAGPCGLTAADDLSRWGYKVTIVEAEEILGGMMSVGIPSYRLPKDLLKLEIDNILKKGLKVETGKILGKDFTVQGLSKDGYDAVLLATGAGKPKLISVPGADNEYVWQGVDFLKKVNSGVKVEIQGELVVIGGGNVAIDVARTAKRLGASEIHVVCLESRDEMPAHEWEIELAIQEDIVFHPSWSPARIETVENKISAVKFIKCLKVFDESGRFNPACDINEEYWISACNVIIAVGQRPDLTYLAEKDQVELASTGTIEVDPVSFSTTAEGVFAGGDAVSGPASVIEAIAAGKEVALSIDRYLRGVDIKEGRGEKAVSSNTPDIKIDKRERTEINLLSPKERINNFKEVELTLTEGEAAREAFRCMNCGI